jgi:hypothetical protein
MKPAGRPGEKTWPTRAQQLGLLILLAVVTALALARACKPGPQDNYQLSNCQPPNGQTSNLQHSMTNL